MVKLHGFQFRKLLNHACQSPAADCRPSRCLVFMLADPSFRNSRHMKYGLPSRAGMPTTGASIWARKEPQLLPRSKSGCSVDDGANLLQCLLWVQWEVSQHHRRPLKRPFSGSRHRTAARGELKEVFSSFYKLLSVPLCSKLDGCRISFLFHSFFLTFLMTASSCHLHTYNMRHFIGYDA